MSQALAGVWTSLPTPLTPWILDAIHSLGHTHMTPVQASTIPLFIGNKDVVVEAVTGSGKTLAFVVPVLERIIRRKTKLKKNEIGALVISPTRELATQIHSVFTTFLSAQPEPDLPQIEDPPPHESSAPISAPIPEHPSALLLISSDNSSPSEDIQRFLSTGADIVVGTPGRIEEFLLGRGKTLVSVKELEVLVLDEADRLLDLGFQTTLTRILTHLPKQRRTGLFSATMTDADAISELVRVGLRNPARVVVKVQSKKIRTVKGGGDGERKGELIEERRIPANLQNFYITCLASEKLVQLVRLVQKEISTNSSAQFIVYFATCACVDYFYRILPALLPSSVHLHSLHGHLSPSARTRTLELFSSSSLTSPFAASSILLATDVAARGLDLPHVDVVIQFDPPADPKAFSHRCGRTARAGRSGKAYVFLAGREVDYVDFMAVRKIPLREHSYILDPSHLAKPSGTERTEDPSVPTFLQQIRTTLSKDRSLHDLAQKSYVSFIRAYSKHEASYIFRLSSLDLIGTARSFGLLRLPRMPELKSVNKEGWEDAPIDWETYEYKDKAQQAKYLQSLEAKGEKEEFRSRKRAIKKQNAPWSQQTAQKQEREKRQEKKGRKRKWLKEQSSAGEASAKAGEKRLAGRAGEAEAEDDWDELAREERLAKKVKKGEISQKEFDSVIIDM